MMREFFRGWRRKGGVLTLVMACMFAAGWVRSHTQIDLVFIPGGMIAVSENGKFSLSQKIRLKSQSPTGGKVKATVESSSFLSRIRLWSLDVSSTKIIQTDYGLIPYPSIVIPLTLLSAWLLFSAPRSRKKTGDVLNN